MYKVDHKAPNFLPSRISAQKIIYYKIQYKIFVTRSHAIELDLEKNIYIQM